MAGAQQAQGKKNKVRVDQTETSSEMIPRRCVSVFCFFVFFTF